MLPQHRRRGFGMPPGLPVAQNPISLSSMATTSTALRISFAVRASSMHPANALSQTEDASNNVCHVAHRATNATQASMIRPHMHGMSVFFALDLVSASVPVVMATPALAVALYPSVATVIRRPIVATVSRRLSHPSQRRSNVRAPQKWSCILSALRLLQPPDRSCTCRTPIVAGLRAVPLSLSSGSSWR